MNKVEDRQTKHDVDIPYQCGRLFAVLERAGGKVGTAKMGRLCVQCARQPRHYLFAYFLGEMTPRLSEATRDEVAEIVDNIANLPPVSFTVVEQGRYYIGYYTQKAAMREGK